MSEIFTARYGGRCPECRQRFAEGDDIGYVDDHKKPVCEDCYDNEFGCVEVDFDERMREEIREAKTFDMGTHLVVCVDAIDKRDLTSLDGDWYFQPIFREGCSYFPHPVPEDYDPRSESYMRMIPPHDVARK